MLISGQQFKGVFARNLQILQAESPEARYASFLDKNANSIWAKDRANGDQLSLIWSGYVVIASVLAYRVFVRLTFDSPFIQPANASTQSSAMDAIVGSLAVG